MRGNARIVLRARPLTNIRLPLVPAKAEGPSQTFAIVMARMQSRRDCTRNYELAPSTNSRRNADRAGGCNARGGPMRFQLGQVYESHDGRRAVVVRARGGGRAGLLRFSDSDFEEWCVWSTLEGQWRLKAVEHELLSAD